MSSLNGEVLHNGGTKNGDSINNGHELDENDFSRLSDRPKLLNLERHKSCDDRSLNDLPVGFSAHPSLRTSDNSDGLFSPGKKSGCNTPFSHFAYGAAFDPHPMIAEAWDHLRRSLVHFRGQPVGTIAALDNSDEKLNYDQVKRPKPCTHCILCRGCLW